MDTAAAELGTNSVSKHQIQPEYGDEQADAGRDCRTRRCRETKLSGANGEWEEFIFPVQLTTSRIKQPIMRIKDRLFDRGWVRSVMATRKCGNIYFRKYFMAVRKFTNIFVLLLILMVGSRDTLFLVRFT